MVYRSPGVVWLLNASCEHFCLTICQYMFTASEIGTAELEANRRHKPWYAFPHVQLVISSNISIAELRASCGRELISDTLCFYLWPVQYVPHRFNQWTIRWSKCDELTILLLIERISSPLFSPLIFKGLHWVWSDRTNPFGSFLWNVTTARICRYEL